MKRMPALGRKLPHAGEVSSNPRPHQKTMHLDLSRLVGLSLLLRQIVKPEQRSTSQSRSTTPICLTACQGAFEASLAGPSDPHRDRSLAC